MDSRPNARRTVRRLLVAFVGIALIAGACSSGSAAPGRIDDELNEPDPLVTDPEPVSGALDNPEKYGLPSLDVLKSNPRGVAEALFDKMFTTTWTMKWLLRAKGFEAGEILVENLPAASPDEFGKLHVAATIGSADVGTQEFAVLDAGAGPRSCVREQGGPWVCDVDDAGPVLQFLSIRGMETLSDLLLESLAVPGLEVQYLMMNGTPAVCFTLPPLPMTEQTLGLDFSAGGAFCLSPEGALLALQAGEGEEEIELRAFEYDVSADPEKFKLPVDVSPAQPAPDPA